MLEKIAEKCKEKGISVAELERRANLRQRTIYKWDVSEPGAKKVKRVAVVLGCSVDDLIDEEEGVNDLGKSEISTD